MTEHEKLARQIAAHAIHDWEPESLSISLNDDCYEDFQNLGNHLTKLIKEALDQAHAAGRAQVLAEGVPILEKLTNKDETK